MKNFVFISPHFPDSYWKFCLALRNKGFNVLGVGDGPFFEISEECKNTLTEYYCCPFMDHFENEVKAIEYFCNKYGKIDFIESNNEYWLLKDAKLRTIFNVTSGVNDVDVVPFRSKIRQKELFNAANIKCAKYTTDLTKEGLVKFASEVGYPLFTKPDDGVGAQGTMKINCEEDIDIFLSSIDKNRRYIVEQFIDGSIVSFDGIANSKSEVVFSTQNIFLVNNDEIVLNNLDDMYYCDPYLDPKFLELGKAVVKAVGLKKRFFHIEFFELKKDYPGIGNKGDRIPLEVNARPAGGYTPDIINFANSCSCYDIYADVMMYDENKEQDYPEKFYCASCSRRNTSSYLYSKEEVIAKYHNNICMAGEFPKVLRDDMGDSYFVAKFKTKEEMMEFDTFVRSKK